MFVNNSTGVNFLSPRKIIKLMIQTHEWKFVGKVNMLIIKHIVVDYMLIINVLFLYYSQFVNARVKWICFPQIHTDNNNNNKLIIYIYIY